MCYKEEIEKIIENIPKDIIDFSKETSKNKIPTQVSSEFLTNKNQGDWAEETLLNAINNNSDKYIAVKYGRDDDIVAGESNFKKFYEDYQKELEEIGKRPDILIFNRKDYPFDTVYINNLKQDIQDKVVPLALCGIEVRSSAFLTEEYQNYMSDKSKKLKEDILNKKSIIIDKFSEILIEKNQILLEKINALSKENAITLTYNIPRNKNLSKELIELLKDIKEEQKQLKKRTFLSITPKVEDLKVVYKWIQKYNVPHYYVQVFFDRAYALSFKDILTLLTSKDLDGINYFIEGDVKNQNKKAIKIDATLGKNILSKITMPKHYSELKRLERGRLLYYVKYTSSASILDKEKFKETFGIEL